MKKALLIVFISMMLLLATSCIAPQKLQQYESLETEPNENGIVEIDGIMYVALPNILWRPADIKNRTLIGELIKPVDSGYMTEIYTFDDDVRKMFIALKSKPEWFVDVERVGPEEYYHFRSDVAFPATDSSGVDTISVRKTSNIFFLNTIHDKGIINQLSALMDKAQSQETEGDKNVYTMELTNSEFPGIEIQVNVCKQGDAYWLYFNEINNNNYGDIHYYAVQIPRELLEKIVGETLPG